MLLCTVNQCFICHGNQHSLQTRRYLVASAIPALSTTSRTMGSKISGGRSNSTMLKGVMRLVAYGREEIAVVQSEIQKVEVGVLKLLYFTIEVTENSDELLKGGVRR